MADRNQTTRLPSVAKTSKLQQRHSEQHWARNRQVPKLSKDMAALAEQPKPKPKAHDDGLGSVYVQDTLSFAEDAVLDLKGCHVLNSLPLLRRWTLHRDYPCVVSKGGEWTALTLRQASVCSIPRIASAQETSFPYDEDKGGPDADSFYASRTGVYSIQVEISVTPRGQATEQQEATFYGIGVRAWNPSTRTAFWTHNALASRASGAWSHVSRVDQFTLMGTEFVVQVRLPASVVPARVTGAVQMTLLHVVDAKF